MNSEDTLLQYAGEPLDTLPESVRRQLDESPEMRKAFEQQTVMKDMMSLLRYEQPDARLEERVRREVRLKISERSPSVLRRFSIHNAHLLPAWVRMAAVVVIMLGLSVLTHREMLRNEMMDAFNVAEEAENQGTELAVAEPAGVLQVSELIHRDAFTTQLPDRYLYPLPELGVAGLDPSLTPEPEPTPAPFLQNPVSLPVIYRPISP